MEENFMKKHEKQEGRRAAGGRQALEGCP